MPALLLGAHHTTSSALHDLEFKGPLRHWSNFLRAVEATDQIQVWSSRVVQFAQKSRDIEAEAVDVGDEHDVQGRFQQSFRQVLGTILKPQSIDLYFADFICLGILVIYEFCGLFTILPNL